MKRLLIPLIFVSTLTACGVTACGGGGSSTPTPHPVSYEPPVISGTNLNHVQPETMAIINLNTASLYSGNDILFYNLIGKGDINGDGYDDLVIGLFRHTTSPSYSGREYDPSGEIKPVVLFYDPVNDTYIVNAQLQSVIHKNQHPRQVAIADFDGDGRNDIFIADHGYDDGPYGNQNTLLLNKSTGFVDGTDTLPQVTDFSHGLVIADFDNNGKPDLLLLNNRVDIRTKCSLYLGFTDCPYNPPKDSESYVLFNNGLAGLSRGTLNIPNKVINFTSTTSDFNLRLYVGHSADFNRDGWPDLVISNHRDIFIIESTGAKGQFSSAQVFGPPPALQSCEYTPVSAITSIDIDSDGENEIVASFTCNLNTAYFRAFKRNKSGTWEDKSDILIGDQTANASIINDGWCYKFEIADVNADGKPDIICQSVRGQGSGNNNVFWTIANGKLQSMNITLQNGAWAGFGTMVKNKTGNAILGFNSPKGQPNLVIKRWKN
jgi:hypothetical protein